MQNQQGQQGIGVSPAQIVGGALASVSAAVVASFFGIGGTLVGAATASVVVTVGGAFYRRSIEQTQARVVRIWRNPQTGRVVREVARPAGPAAQPRRIRWRPVMGALVLVLALTFGAVTAIEVAAEKPLAAVVRQEPPDVEQTSLGAVVEAVTDSAPPDTPARATADVRATAQLTPTGDAQATATGVSAPPGRSPTVPASTAPTVAPTRARPVTPLRRTPVQP